MHEVQKTQGLIDKFNSELEGWILTNSFMYFQQYLVSKCIKSECYLFE